MKVRTYKVIAEDPADAQRRAKIARQLNQTSKEKLIDLVQKRPEYILELKEPDRELRKIALMEKPELIKDLSAPTEDDFLDAVREDGLLLEFISSRPKKIIDEALRQNGESIQFVKSPTKQQQKAAVVSEPFAIQYLKDAEEEIKMQAVRGNGLAIQFLDKPSEALQLVAVKQHPSAISLIENPTKKCLTMAIETNGTSIEFVEDPDESLQLLAIENSDKAVALRYIKNPTPKVEREAYFRDKSLLCYLKNPTEDVQLDAIAADPTNILYLEKPTKKVQQLLLKSLDQHPDLLDQVKELDPKVLEEYEEQIAFQEKTERKMPIPEKLNSVQLKILRYMDLRHQDKVLKYDLRKEPWAEEKLVQRLMKRVKGKEITRKQVVEFRQNLDPKSKLGEMILSEGRFAKVMIRDDVDALFTEDSSCFLVYLNPKHFENYEIDEKLQEVLNQIVKEHKEPYASKLLSVGYVKYTLFKKDVWIDELGSQLLAAIPEAEGHALDWLLQWVLDSFVREMRYRAYQKFYIPDNNLRQKLYELEPSSIYEQLPEKALFQTLIVKGIDPLVNNKECWCLAADSYAQQIKDQMDAGKHKAILTSFREQLVMNKQDGWLVMDLVKRYQKTSMDRMLLNQISAEYYDDQDYPGRLPFARRTYYTICKQALNHMKKQPASANVEEVRIWLRGHYTNLDIIEAFQWLQQVNGSKEVSVSTYAGLNSISVGVGPSHPQYTLGTLNREVNEYYQK